MKYIKYLVSFSLSLIIMGLTVITMIIFLMTGPLMNQETYLNVLSKVGAYEEIQTDIQENLEYMMLANNIPMATVSEFVTVEEVEAIVNRDMIQVFEFIKGERSEIDALDMTPFEVRFSERMNNFFRDNGYYLDEEQKTDVELMTKNMNTIVKGTLQFIDFSALTKSSSVQNISSILSAINFNIVKNILILIILVLISLNLLVWFKEIIQGLLWNGYGFVTGGLLLYIVFNSGYRSGFYNHLIINIDYIKSAVGLLIGDTFMMLYKSGVFLALLGIVFMLPYWFKLYKTYMLETE